MNAGSIMQAEIAPAPQSWVFRHPRWIVGWVILVATGCVLCDGIGRVQSEMGGAALRLIRPSGSDRRRLGREGFRRSHLGAAPVLGSAACRCFLAGERVAK